MGRTPDSSEYQQFSAARTEAANQSSNLISSASRVNAVYWSGRSNFFDALEQAKIRQDIRAAYEALGNLEMWLGLLSE